MKRICLFAGYDKNNIIHDYVVYYLKELSTISDVYYMADNDISEEEKLKIIPYVKGAYGFHHKKYDFGSWQELINIIGWEKLLEYDELILANDSVFGPIYPIKDFFNKLQSDTEWDICGINKDVKNNTLHLSSYFLVFKKTAFNTNIFKKHIESICLENKLADVVDKYEVPFMKIFYNNGFVVKCILENNLNVYYQWKEAVNGGSPFIKKKIFNKDIFYRCHKSDWKAYIKHNTDYNIKYIEDYFKGKENVILEYIPAKPLNPLIKKLKDFYKWLIRINISKGKFYFKLFGCYIVKINKKYYIYILFGKPMKSKINIIPIKTIN